MGRRNRPRRRPQADKRLRIVGVRREQIDQRKLGRALLRIMAVESAADLVAGATETTDTESSIHIGSGATARATTEAGVTPGGDDERR